MDRSILQWRYYSAKNYKLLTYTKHLMYTVFQFLVDYKVIFIFKKYQ